MAYKHYEIMKTDPDGNYVVIHMPRYYYTKQTVKIAIEEKIKETERDVEYYRNWLEILHNGLSKYFEEPEEE